MMFLRKSTMRRKIHGDEGDVRTEKCQGRLTVYFEDPFWVGVFERIENGKISAAKVTFGAEPKRNVNWKKSAYLR